MPNPVYSYLLDIYDLVWLGLWHINHCGLSNAKSYLYIYILNIWFVNTFVDNIFKGSKLTLGSSIAV